MVELLALLLPIAAASGWYAAQRHYGGEHLRRRIKKLHASYTRGVGFLLQDKVDEALEALSPLFRSDAEGLELRLAIGHLFRRKGLVEKALAVHEGLAGQEGLSEEQRRFVSYQLGMDYLAAGLLDRAEAAFNGLLQTDRYRADALQQLLKIYQRERDWRRAIECTHSLRQLHKVPNRETVAQFYCELAAEASFAGCKDEARRLLKLALDDDPRCVRATIAMGRLLVESEDWPGALAVLTNVERQDADFIPEILEMVVLCFEQTHRHGDLLNYLQRVFWTFACDDAACLLAEWLCESEGLPSATEFLQGALAAGPSLKLSNRLLTLLVEGRGEPDRSSLKLILQSMHEPISRPPGYRCRRCGFQGHELHWCCPSCHGWETITPNRAT